jgi:hypothetical protein
MERLLSLRLMKKHHATIHIISHETTVTGGKVASCAVIHYHKYLIILGIWDINYIYVF